MKMLLLFPMFILLSLTSISQDKITYLTKGNYKCIETYESSISYPNELMKKSAYCLDVYNYGILHDGINTAIEWAELNIEHKMSFEKEVCRLYALKNTHYEGFIKRFPSNEHQNIYDSFSDELILIFIGYSDGSCEINLKYSSIKAIIKLRGKDMIKKFRDLIEGKSVNPEIDDIFKKD